MIMRGFRVLCAKIKMHIKCILCIYILKLSSTESSEFIINIIIYFHKCAHRYSKDQIIFTLSVNKILILKF